MTDRGELIGINGDSGEKELAKSALAREALLESFYESDKYIEIKDQIDRAFDQHGSAWFGNPNVQRDLRGKIFEELALTYFYEKLVGRPENRALADFLQNILANKKYREVDFYSPSDFGGESEINKEGENTENLFRTIKHLPNKKDEENPDALLVDVQTDTTTGQRKAVIVGALDAKVNGFISEKQAQGFKKNLWDLVNGLKDQYKDDTRKLDLDFALPEEIDIVDPHRMGIKTIRPYNGRGFTEHIGTQPQILVPITFQEINNLMWTMIRDSSDRHSQDSEK